MVSWIDTTGTGGWEEKAKILVPLRQLVGKVSFKIGVVNGPEDADRELFVRAMEEELGEDFKLGAGNKSPTSTACPSLSASSESAPSALRMLAFDPRQERHLYTLPSRESALGESTARLEIGA